MHLLFFAVERIVGHALIGREKASVEEIEHVRKKIENPLGPLVIRAKRRRVDWHVGRFSQAKLCE
jgi:hypothetical protein